MNWVRTSRTTRMWSLLRLMPPRTRSHWSTSRDSLLSTCSRVKTTRLSNTGGRTLEAMTAFVETKGEVQKDEEEDEEGEEDEGEEEEEADDAHDEL